MLLRAILLSITLDLDLDQLGTNVASLLWLVHWSPVLLYVYLAI